MADVITTLFYFTKLLEKPSHTNLLSQAKDPKVAHGVNYEINIKI